MLDRAAAVWAYYTLDQIQIFVVANLVGGVRAAVDTPIVQRKQGIVQSVCAIGIGQEVDVACTAYNLVRRQRENRDGCGVITAERSRQGQFLRATDCQGLRSAVEHHLRP